ncbi:MAG: hypothetical protein AAGF86_04075 [Pseudomonadota bacterium]
MIRSNTQKGRLTAAVIAATTALLAASPSASAGKISDLSSGAWTGGAFTNAHTGTFSHCAVNAKYRSGVALYFAVTGERQWSMAFSAKHWRFEQGQKYAVHYQVDDGPVIRTDAVARSAALMQVHLPVNGRVFSRFQHGTTLKVAAGRKVMRFTLTGAGPMLNKLLRCASHHAGAAETGPRSSSRKAPAARTGARLIDVSYQ